MSHRPSLSAFRPPAGGPAPTGRRALLVALLALVLAGVAGWVLPQRALLPLEDALRADTEESIPAEPQP